MDWPLHKREGRGITSGPIVQPTNLSSSHYVEDGRRVRDVNREGERRCDRGRVEVSDAAFFFIKRFSKCCVRNLFLLVLDCGRRGHRTVSLAVASSAFVLLLAIVPGEGPFISLLLHYL